MCRLVVNVYKHGDGRSLNELRSVCPEYLDDPFGGLSGEFSDPKYKDHTHLKVNDEQFQAFSDAILAFWRDVPNNVFERQINNVPQWFENAVIKDCPNSQQTSKT